jgi:hypothetical protein
VYSVAHVCSHLLGILERCSYRINAFGFDFSFIAHFGSRVARKTANFRFVRVLHLDIAGRMSRTKSYRLANDFANWLTRTKYLSVKGGFQEVTEKDGKTGNRRTWILLCRMMARFEHLKQLDIASGEGALVLPDISGWLTPSHVKILHINGLTEWKHGTVELDLKVCLSFTAD